MYDEVPNTVRKQKAKENSLWQQNLKAWRPLMTPSCVSMIFVVVAMIFIILGALILDASMKTVEMSKRYDDECAGISLCNVTLTIEKDMDAPIFFYYRLVNFYQNHRSYVQDFSIDQLQGEETETRNCRFDKDRNDKPVYPCGLIGNSFFNDVFGVTYVASSTGFETQLTGNNWDGSDISWKSDQNHKFKNASGNLADVTRKGSQGNTLPLVTDQDYQVWFRVAGLPRFNKLYRKIGNQDLKKNDQLIVTIANNFDTSSFGGEKYIFLSTTTWLGGSNFFLGACYVIVGSICALYAAIMLLKRILDPRPLGQMKYYRWTGLGPTES